MEKVEQQFRDACFNNLNGAYPILIQHPELMDAPILNGETFFLFACKRRWVEVVDWLISHGSKGYLIPDHNQSLPIHWVAQLGEMEIANLILGLDLPPDYLISRNLQGRTPLWYAINYGQLEMTQLLFRPAPKALFVKDPLDRNPLVLASDNSNEQAMIFLLEAAIATFDLDLIRPLLNPYAHARGYTTCWQTAIRNRWTRVLILCWRIDPEIFRAHPEWFEIAANSNSIWRHLIQFGHTYGPDWINSAIGTPEKVKRLLKITTKAKIYRQLLSMATSESIRISGCFNNILHHAVNQVGRQSAKIVAEAVEGINRFHGPTGVWIALEHVNFNKHTPLQWAIIKSSTATEFLIWLTGSVPILEHVTVGIVTDDTVAVVTDDMIVLLYKLGVTVEDMKLLPGTHEGDYWSRVTASISEADCISTRFEVHFSRSLTARLLYFV